MIREWIVVEGRDDRAAVARATDARTIATHGYGISAETFALLDKAYEEAGLIIFTDPDRAGEQIRQRLSKRYPLAKQAYLARQDARKDGDLGIENAEPAAILEALEKAHCTLCEEAPVFGRADLARFGLNGGPGAAAKREALGKALGIGYGNASSFLKKLNDFGISREEFETYGKTLFSGHSKEPELPSRDPEQ